jgi:hypothetical protein
MSVLRFVFSGPNRPSSKAVYCAFLILAIALTFLSGQQQLLWRLTQLMSGASSTVGTVAGLDCRDHGYVNYDFTIAGKIYAASQHFVDGADCRNLQIGQRIEIIYDANNPANNYALSEIRDVRAQARQAFWSDLASVVYFILCAPLFLTWLWSVVSKWTTPE